MLFVTFLIKSVILLPLVASVQTSDDDVLPNTRVARHNYTWPKNTILNLPIWKMFVCLLSSG